jgi:LPXTG-motif cell wall-anchored protein
MYSSTFERTVTLPDGRTFTASVLAGVPTGMGDAASDAATAMNNALLAHGYKQSDMGLYQAFQSTQGLIDDGYPGTATMTALKDVLFQNGNVEIAPVTVYPWLSQANYGAYPWDGVNAPTMAEWAPGGGGGGGGGGTVVTPTVVVPGTVPATTSTTTGMSSTTKAVLIGAGLVGVGIIGYALYKRNKKVRVVHLRKV